MTVVNPYVTAILHLQAAVIELRAGRDALNERPDARAVLARVAEQVFDAAKEVRACELADPAPEGRCECGQPLALGRCARCWSRHELGAKP